MVSKAEQNHSTARMRLWLVIIVAAVGSIASAASAVPIAFDNFGPGDTYNNSGRWLGTIGPNSTKIATSFAPTLSGQIAGLTAAIITNFSGAGSLTLSIRLGANGPTGALLWQSLIPDTLLSPFGSVLALSISGPTVTAGTTYWIVAETDAPTFYTWQANNTGDRGPIASNLNDAGWPVSNDSLRSALRVTLVPEPGTAGLVALGMAWLSIRRRGGARQSRYCGLPPNKALQLTRRRPGACKASQPAGGRLGGRSAARPPEYPRGTRAARS